MNLGFVPNGTKIRRFGMFFAPQEATGFSPGLKAISAKIIKASAGRMCFVPEGQHDSSQARSAWSHEEHSPVPAGRLNGSRLRLDANQYGPA